MVGGGDGELGDLDLAFLFGLDFLDGLNILLSKCGNCHSSCVSWLEHSKRHSALNSQICLIVMISVTILMISVTNPFKTPLSVILYAMMDI